MIAGKTDTDSSETDFSGISGIFVKTEIDLPVFDSDRRFRRGSLKKKLILI